MNDIFYDTSLTIYAIPETTVALTALISTSAARLNDHAQALRDHLSAGRVAYEREEERAKIGGLRDCTFALLRGEEDDPEPHGVAITLLYDKVGYKLILYGDDAYYNAKSSGKQNRAEYRLPLLLVKASSSVTTRFLSFLETNFQSPTIVLLRLPASHLPIALNQYINDLVAAHDSISAKYALLDLLRDTIGVLKLTISITNAEAAKSLRTIDIDVPPETLYQLITDAQPTQFTGFLGSLHNHLHARTGLLLPLIPTPSTAKPAATNGAAAAEADDDEEEPPLKLSRMSTTAFALSLEGRVKLSAKAVQAVDARPGLGSGEENVVRTANRTLLRGLIAVALTLRE